MITFISDALLFKYNQNVHFDWHFLIERGEITFEYNYHRMHIDSDLDFTSAIQRSLSVQLFKLTELTGKFRIDFYEKVVYAIYEDTVRVSLHNNREVVKEAFRSGVYKMVTT